MRALTTAATGLDAQSQKINDISNDLANVNTDGYKRSRTEFQDLMYETIREPGGTLGAGSQSPVGIQQGLGVKVGASYKIMEQGSPKMTARPYDLMIEGKGFFPVQMPNGEIAYTRVGNFVLDGQSRLTTSAGGQLIPQIQIPPTAMSIQIGANGEVKASYQNGTEAVIGQLQLVTFQNEQGLMAVGGSLYKPSQATGAPLQGVPGENGLGIIQQGALESSNVNVANSMVDMIQTQRGYEMNTKVMGVVDQMMGATANIK